MSGINLQTQASVTRLSPNFKAEKEMQQIADKVGERSVGGRLTNWVRSKVGGESRTTEAFRKALLTRVGTNAVADDILSKAGLTEGKPLSRRKAKEVIRLTNEYLDNRQKSATDQNSQVAKVVRTARHGSDPSTATNPTKTSPTPSPTVPTTGTTAQKKAELSDVPTLPVLSPSAKALQNALKERFKLDTTGMTKTQVEDHQKSISKLADFILSRLDLSDNQSITDGQIALANRYAERFEGFRDSDLGSLMKAKPLVNAFVITWNSIAKNNAVDDPRLQLLRDDEIVALTTYTQCDYGIINNGLRGVPGNDLTNKDHATIAAINSGLSKLPKFEGICFRGADLMKSVNDGMKDSLIYQDAAFTSTTANPDCSFPGAHQLAIMSKGGCDISFLSKEPQEIEVLFPIGTQFKVVNWTGDADYGSNAQHDSKPSIDNGVQWGTAKLLLQEIT